MAVLPDEYDDERLQRCMAAFGEIVERTDEVRFTITSDFVGAVRERVSDPDYAAAYEQHRRFEVAAAKTIPQDDGTIDLVMDVGLLHRQTDPGVAERTFRHEAYHVAIHQRGEALTDIRERHGLDRWSVGGIYLSMAGIACEEFRVERALWDQGEVEKWTEFADTATRLEERVREVSRQYQDDPNVGTISHDVMEAVHSVATWTGYVAAARDGGDPAGDVPDDVDERVLGQPWRDAVAELERLPAADLPADRDELDRHAMQVALVLAKWIMHIGFGWEELDDGRMYFHVLKPHLWVP